jgi:hypothetical protein
MAVVFARDNGCHIVQQVRYAVDRPAETTGQRAPLQGRTLVRAKITEHRSLDQADRHDVGGLESPDEPPRRGDSTY